MFEVIGCSNILQQPTLSGLPADRLLHSQIRCDETATPVSRCNSVIEDVLLGLSAPIKDTGAELEVGRLPSVGVDREQLVQLFTNLISNAIKYRGSQTPRITVKAKRIADKWLFSVGDNGIGIDPLYADKIFDMFARLHGKGQYPGTGIGLAICKKIVTSHGGSIWVESKVGQGSVFLFTLPVVSNKGESKMNKTIQLLLVEDTPSDVRLTQEALKRSDISFDLQVLTDGVEAMNYLNGQVACAGALPDIILLDLNMPKKNGHEVLEEIQANDTLRLIPVVLLTVSERDEDVLEALRLKMNYYVSKPVTSQKLSTLIKAIHELHLVATMRSILDWFWREIRTRLQSRCLSSHKIPVRRFVVVSLKMPTLRLRLCLASPEIATLKFVLVSAKTRTQICPYWKF